MIYVKGSSSEKQSDFCAHCDTLGLMVRSIKSNGMLAVTNIGGPIIPTLGWGILPHSYKRWQGI